MINHYKKLGLTPSATQQEIDQAFEKLALKIKPEIKNGDTYFAGIFKEIEEAYAILSNEKKRSLYDRDNNFNQDKDLSASKDSTPTIEYFESDKESFVEGDTILVRWKTTNAESIIIKPFGEVSPSGSRYFKLKNFNKDILTLTLRASNPDSGEVLTKSISLKNEIYSELDFSDEELEEVEEVELSESDNKKEEVKTGIPERRHEIYTEPKPEFQATEFVENSGTQRTNPQPEENFEGFFSFRGRIRRSTYFLRCLLLGILTFFAYLISLDATNNYNYENSDNSIIISGLLYIVIAILSFMQFIKRLHDISMSGWFSIILIIPYVGALFGLIVLFIDSSKATNRWGPDPKGRQMGTLVKSTP